MDAPLAKPPVTEPSVRGSVSHDESAASMVMNERGQTPGRRKSAAGVSGSKKLASDMRRLSVDISYFRVESPPALDGQGEPQSEVAELGIIEGLKNRLATDAGSMVVDMARRLSVNHLGVITPEMVMSHEGTGFDDSQVDEEDEEEKEEEGNNNKDNVTDNDQGIGSHEDNEVKGDPCAPSSSRRDEKTKKPTILIHKVALDFDESHRMTIFTYTLQHISNNLHLFSA